MLLSCDEAESDPVVQPRDLGVVDAGGGGAVSALRETPAAEDGGAVSPDGQWIAVESVEAGIVVWPFPDAEAGRWQVSTTGGFDPLWSAEDVDAEEGTSGGIVVVQNWHQELKRLVPVP